MCFKIQNFRSPIPSSGETLTLLFEDVRKKWETSEKRRMEEREAKRREADKEKEEDELKGTKLRKEIWIRPDGGRRQVFIIDLVHFFRLILENAFVFRVSAKTKLIQDLRYTQSIYFRLTGSISNAKCSPIGFTQYLPFTET